VISMLVALHSAVRGSGFQDDCTEYAAIEERVGQQRLRQVHCNASSTGKEVEKESIMGWGRSR
jgi:hypothetical protein